MRFSILLAAILAVTFIYVSCNKHTSQRSTTRTSDKVLSGWADSAQPALKTKLTFDGSNEIIREETANDYSTYEFSRDSITIREFSKEEDRLVYEFKGKLDSLKRLISGTATSCYIISAPDTVQHQYEYNAQGYLLSEKRISGAVDTFSIVYEYEENLVTKVSTYSNNVLYNTKEFTYYENEIRYSLPEEIKFRKNLNHLVGNSSNKLLKKTISMGKNGKQTYTVNHQYSFDPNGYASQMINKKGKKVSGVVNFYYGEKSSGIENSVAAN
jgi:hypothetical protein